MPRITYLAPDTDAYVDSVTRHLDEFTEQTGIDVDVRSIPSDEYFSNDIQGHLGAENPPDVFMSGPVLLWEHVGAGLVEPLDAHVADASAEFDIDDFFSPLIASNRWTGRFGDKLGTGSLWEIPVNCEAYNLTYIPATLERLGVEVPKTWEDYFRAASLVKSRSGGKVNGFAQRGVQVWHTMYTGYASQFWAYGAEDFDAEGRCAIASPEGVAATQAFIDALQESGPPHILNQRWYELAMDFCAGEYGLIVDSDHYVAFYEDPAMSTINGRTGYAQTPIGPSGRRESNLWTWSLVMSSRSTNKGAAWKFVEWAAGKEFLLRSAFEGNMNPTRRSTWDHESFITFSSNWGNFYAVARQLVDSEARVLVTPAPNYLVLADRWVRALRDAYSGNSGVAEALEAAAVDIDAIVQH